MTCNKSLNQHTSYSAPPDQTEVGTFYGKHLIFDLREFQRAKHVYDTLYKERTWNPTHKEVCEFRTIFTRLARRTPPATVQITAFAGGAPTPFFAHVLSEMTMRQQRRRYNYDE